MAEHPESSSSISAPGSSDPRKASVSRLIPHTCKNGCYNKVKNVINRTNALEEKVEQLYGVICMLLNKPLPPTRMPVFPSSPATAANKVTKTVVFRKATEEEKRTAHKRPIDEITLSSDGEDEQDEEEDGRPKLKPFTAEQPDYSSDGADEGPIPFKKARTDNSDEAPLLSLIDEDAEGSPQDSDRSPPQLDAQVGIQLGELSDFASDEGEDGDDLNSIFVKTKWLLEGEPLLGNNDALVHQDGRPLSTEEIDLCVERAILMGPSKASVGSFRDHYEEVEWTSKVGDDEVEKCLKRLTDLGMLSTSNNVSFRKCDAETFGDFQKFSLLLAERAIRLPEYQQTFLPGF